MIRVSTLEIRHAINLLRVSARFDESANRIGFALRFRLRLFRKTGIRLFGRKTVAALLATEQYAMLKGHRRNRVIDRLA